MYCAAEHELLCPFSKVVTTTHIAGWILNSFFTFWHLKVSPDTISLLQDITQIRPY